MQELQVIETKTILEKEVSIYGDFDNPLFKAKDVAEWIKHTDLSRMVYLVDEEEKLKRTLYVSGQNREMWFLTEDGLYEVLMQSRKPIAKQFKKQVKQILKDIRKNDAYLTPQKIEEVLLNPDVIIQLAQNLKNEQEKRQLAEYKIATDAPKVLFADSVSASKTSISVNELAKFLRQNGIDIGQNRLYTWLRNNKYLIKRKGLDWNTPTQTAMDKGLFEVRKIVITRSHGTEDKKTTRVTGKGQIYFLNKFLGDVE